MMATLGSWVFIAVLYGCVTTSLTKDIFYNKIGLDIPATMHYSFLIREITLAQCAMNCTRLSGCKLFHVSSGSCYILNMVTTGIGSVSLNSIHVEEQLKETCLSTGYTPLLHGIFCVDMSTYKRTWPEARAVCNDTGGRLLIMTSVELSLKWEPIKDMTTNAFWIGGSDEAEEGTWVWLDGSGVTGSGWVPGQPDNYFGNEHCLQLLEGLLNDTPCVKAVHFLCEKPYPFVF